jgi:hypothetical protein
MSTSSAITALLAILVFTIMGAGIIASGQVFLAIREIALNTRKDEGEGNSSYTILLTVAKINNLLGWLVIIGGVIIAALTSQTGGGFGSRLFY